MKKRRNTTADEIKVQLINCPFQPFLYPVTTGDQQPFEVAKSRF
jgi:hypothetical protein